MIIGIIKTIFSLFVIIVMIYSFCWVFIDLCKTIVSVFKNIRRRRLHKNIMQVARLSPCDIDGDTLLYKGKTYYVNVIHDLIVDEHDCEV